MITTISESISTATKPKDHHHQVVGAHQQQQQKFAACDGGGGRQSLSFMMFTVVMAMASRGRCSKYVVLVVVDIPATSYLVLFRN